MELVIIAVLTVVGLAAMYVKMVDAQKKVKENEALEDAIKEQEVDAKERDRDTLDRADIGATVDFLNSLSNEDRQD